MTAAKSREAPYIEGSLFEGLFNRQLRPTGAFADELRRAGYDVDKPVARYSLDVWMRCLEIARQHTQAHLPPREGNRAIGRLITEGFFDTLVGKVIAVGFPLLGPEAVVKRIPRYFGSAVGGVEQTVTQEGPRCWRLVTMDPQPLPDADAGAIEAGLARTGANVEVEVAVRKPDGYEILIRW